MVNTWLIVVNFGEFTKVYRPPPPPPPREGGGRAHGFGHGEKATPPQPHPSKSKGRAHSPQPSAPRLSKMEGARDTSCAWQKPSPAPLTAFAPAPRSALAAPSAGRPPTTEGSWADARALGRTGRPRGGSCAPAVRGAGLGCAWDVARAPSILVRIEAGRAWLGMGESGRAP